MEVTYIANEGFLVAMGDRKILLDALFGYWESDWCDVPSAEVIEKMETGTGPFDGVDVILVTHAHVDHFNAQIVARHLENNPAGILVGPRVAVEELEKSANYAAFSARVKGIMPAPGTSLKVEVNGVGVWVWRLPHGPYYVEDEATGEMRDKHQHVQHLAFTVEAGGERFFHSGDWSSAKGRADPELLSEVDSVEVAFLNGGAYLSLYGMENKAIEGRKKPAQLVLMHLLPGGDVGEATEEEKTALSGMTIFSTPMESRWFSHGNIL